jgi:Flp pilus assembly pilin Flp
MTTLRNAWRGFLREDNGQDLLEYAMLVALISIFALGAVSAVGETINGVFWETISAATAKL